MNALVNGSRVLLRASFTDPITRELTDPTAVNFSVEAPDDTQQTAAGTKESTGLYHAYFDVDQAGRWQAEVEGTGNAGTVEQTTFEVTERTIS